jgi:molybdopterin converting factor small subunit
MPRVFLPASLREQAGGEAVIELPGSSLREVLAALEEKWPGVVARLIVGDQLRPGWGVSIGGRMVREGLRAKLALTDEVHFIPAVGGG